MTQTNQCIIAIAVALIISSLTAMHVMGGGASEYMEIDRYCYEMERDGQIYIVNIKGGIVKE